MHDEGWLSDVQFTDAIAALPLVSVDLCVVDPTGRLLVGLRRNRPAQGYWFTPGARIRKSEAIWEALLRLGQEELGLPADSIRRAVLMGAWDHFYPDSAFDGEVSTHYVNLPSWIRLTDQEAHELGDALDVRKDQHDAWRWLSSCDGDLDGRLHPYARANAAWLIKHGLLA
jgi:colanic acid biosynthesis protein WcaH